VLPGATGQTETPARQEIVFVVHVFDEGEPFFQNRQVQPVSV
jgi:hypothetical protein